MVTHQGGIKLLDFGIARAATQLHQTVAGNVKGKVGYMAPEQCRGRSVDRRADIYGAGAILYLMATGVRPFENLESDAGMMAQMEATLHGNFLRPGEVKRDLHEELERIILKAMALLPQERYATARAMLTDLERFAASEGVFPSAGELADVVMSLFPEEGTAIADTLDSPSMRARDAMATPAPLAQGPGTGTHDESAPTALNAAYAPQPKRVQEPAGPTRAARRKLQTLPPSQTPALGEAENVPTEARPPPRKSALLAPQPQVEATAKETGEELEAAEPSQSITRSSSRGALMVVAVGLTVVTLGAAAWMLRDPLTWGDAQPVPVKGAEATPEPKPKEQVAQDVPAGVEEKPVAVAAPSPSPEMEKPAPEKPVVADAPKPAPVVAAKPSPPVEKPKVAEPPRPSPGAAAKPAAAPKPALEKPVASTAGRTPQVAAPPPPVPKPVAAAPKGAVTRVTVPGPTDRGVGLVRVRCASDALDVFVDGNKIGRTPLDMQVPVGPHNVELRSAGAAAGPVQRINVAFDSEYMVEAN
jgi:serine/threonine-protein kinase